MHVLLVEDDDGVAVPLAHGLQREGHGVDRARTAAEALFEFGRNHVDLVLLDLGLPDGDGLDVCREIRAISDVPLIILTARDGEPQRVAGLDAGADDYVVKPFGVGELAARIRAVARRSAGPGKPSIVNLVGPTGRLVIDHQAGTISLDGQPLDLSPKERGLLVLLAQDPGRLFARQEILERVWSPTWYGPTKTLDVHVAALRRKLGDAGWIETVRSGGYRLISEASCTDA
ncbi:MAG: response regulator transcription factor [Ilumatobacteraceae bacterium]